MQAVILAGQENSGALKSVAPCQWEADIPIADLPMVEYVIRALQAAQGIDEIVLVGPAGHGGVRSAPVRDSVWDNIASGMENLARAEERVLVVTADIPLITGSIVDQFLRAAPRADVVYPVVPKSVVLAKFPQTHRTYVRLREATVTGGNLFLVNPEKIEAIRRRAEILLSHRKSPRKLAQDIGLGLLIKLLLGRLSLGEAEIKVSRMLGVTGRVLVFPHPEIGVDVDKVSDFALVEAAILTRSRTGASPPGA